MKKFGSFWIAAAALCLLTVGAAAQEPQRELCAVGEVVGIRLREDAVTVAGFVGDSPARRAGLREGDRLLAVDGHAVGCAQDVSACLRGAEPVAVTVGRGKETASYLVQPEERDGAYRLGVRLRDSLSGIGTVTWYDSGSGRFGALGHGVCGADGKTPAVIRSGSIAPAEVTGVVKGVRGKAGTLRGALTGEPALGEVDKCTPRGIFGSMEPGQALGTRVPVAQAGSAQTGQAEILSTLSGQPDAYGVKILRIYPEEPERNLLLEVTDERLLSQTGGIVQGMSGSPILQDGHLIGAVTHVLVGDPTKGYGILIGNMLEAA